MTYCDRNDLIETMHMLKVCVLVPTYNNAGTLRSVVSDILDYSDSVIVINDGSTDDTAEILQDFGHRITKVSYQSNKGKGHALKAGFRKARELGYEYAITIDSDGQHYPEEIPNFVRAIAENPGAMIIGERDLSNVDINGKSTFANKFSNFWFSVQTGLRLRDTQTGYRAYPLKNLHGLSIMTSRYEAELELLVFAAWNGVRIVSMPIKVYYPPRSQRVSHFKPIKDFSRISVLNTILCVGALVYGLPMVVLNAIAKRKIFNKEFTPFTRVKGKRRPAALTLGRMASSFYGFSIFAIIVTGVFIPFIRIYFRIGKNTPEKRYGFHIMLQKLSAFINRCYPSNRTTYENPSGENLAVPAIVICNHQSHLDLPLMIASNPRLIFLTNDAVWNTRLYGSIIRNAEYLPISAGMDVLIPRLKDLRDRGYSIAIFPEGTRSPDCRIARFHKGAFLLAQELGMDIVPMVLHGPGHYLPKHESMFMKGDMVLKTLPRVGRNEIEGMELREQAKYFRRLIRKEYDKYAAEKETVAYFKNLILYKYAYHGWDIVSRCKHTLRQLPQYSGYIETRGRYGSVRILNSGIGTFALVYALVNNTTETEAYESNPKDYETASNTACLPKNLHYLKAVWNSEYRRDGDADLTIVLNSHKDEFNKETDTLFLKLKS